MALTGILVAVLVAVTGQIPVVPRDALLNGSGSLLAPLDRRTLSPRPPWADLGEFHQAWSVSPDGRTAAFGISAPGENRRIGVRTKGASRSQGTRAYARERRVVHVIDLRSLREIARVPHRRRDVDLIVPR